MTQTTKLGAVLFDCDGVLVDSERLTNQLLRDDLAARGLDMTLEEVMGLFVGGTTESVMREAMRLGAEMPADWIELFYGKMFALLERQVEAVPGAPELVDALYDRSIPMAVGSNGPSAKMQITLRRTGLLTKLSPHIYSARDLGAPKPAPDIYFHAAEQVGVAPEKCVVIEDSASGAKAARAAGMRCIGYATEGQGAALAPHCDVVAVSMAQVSDALGL
ncbi:MAG: HAD-IA family hydrolase [Pseudomonadota bacterium]